MGRAESVVVHQLSGLLASGSLTGLPDRLLLERFVTQPGEVAEAAFSALVARHGPMVLNVCRTMLPDHQDAQDAFQVTFVLLAAKANSLRHKQLLANWLYGVAMRSALKIRSNSARRWRHERKVAERTHEAVAPVETDAGDYAALYEEINALPERYRGPIVLCHLEGLSRDMAASLLDCPVSTLNVRLMRARNRLKERLTRRQGHLPAGFVGSILDGSTKVPLSAPTARLAMDAASGTIGMFSSSLLVLAKEVQMAMFMTKFKVCVGLVLTLGVVTAGVATVARSQTTGERVPSVKRDVKTPERTERGNLVVQKPTPDTKLTEHVTGRTLDPNEFPNPTGWSWLMRPKVLKTSEDWLHHIEDGFLSGYSHIDPTDGSLRIHFVLVGPTVKVGSYPFDEYRLIVLDAHENRYLPTLFTCSRSFGMIQGAKTPMEHAVYRLDRTKLDPAKAAYIGVERIERKQAEP